MASNCAGMSRIFRRPDASSPAGPVSSLFLNEWRRRSRLAAAAREPSVGTDGVDDELRRASETQKDDAAARRRVREAFKNAQLSIDHCLLKTAYPGVRMEEMYETNSRGAEIFSKYWIPQLSPLKAMIFFCHGYGDTCTFFFEGVARKLASSGYGVFAMDYPGFGLSDGLHGYIPNFDILVDDVIEQFSKVKENPEYHNLACFLLGQSMGGAVALKVHLKQPQAWNGAILIAPMCKIADDMVPHWLVKQLLIGISNFLPKQKLVPTKDLADMAFKDKIKRSLAIYNVISYKDKPRLRTAAEMLRATQEIEDHSEEVSLPLLILHGEADVVTDPSVSKALYEKAVSKDKKLILYEGAYHAILEEAICSLVRISLAWNFLEQQRFWSLLTSELMVSKGEVPKILLKFCSQFFDPQTHSVALFGLFTLVRSQTPTLDLINTLLLCPPSFRDFSAVILASWTTSNCSILFSILKKWLHEVLPVNRSKNLDVPGSKISADKVNTNAILEFLHFLDMLPFKSDMWNSKSDCISEVRGELLKLAKKVDMISSSSKKWPP